MTVQVDVQIACDERGIPESSAIRAWVDRAMVAAGRGNVSGVSVRVVAAAEIQRLNRVFRDIDKPTNVLSFPAGKIEGLPAAAGLPLGDVVVCASVVSDESLAQGKAVGDHWAHMIVHGTLHLLGFDHETDDEAVAMEALETKILTGHGVADPYGESRQ